MFKEVTPVFIGTGRHGRNALRFGIRKSKRGHFYGYVSIPRTAAEELGWNAGEHLRLLVGDGPEDGVIRLERDDNGAITLARGGRHAGLAARVGNFKKLPQREHKSQPTIFEVRDGGIDIDLPGDPENGARPLGERPSQAAAVPKPLAPRGMSAADIRATLGRDGAR